MENSVCPPWNSISVVLTCSQAYLVSWRKVYFPFFKLFQKALLQNFLHSELIFIYHLAIPLCLVGILLVFYDLFVVFFGHIDPVVQIAQPNDLTNRIFPDHIV